MQVQWQSRKYELVGKRGVVARITIEAPTITGAEQNIVVLDGELKPIAIVEMQPGIDSREVR